MRSAHRIAYIAALIVLGPMPAASVAQSAVEASFPFRDAREAGPASVRFSAAQMSRDGPVVVLFGATTPSWHKARAAVRQSVANGYPVGGVFMGPTDQAPSLEIYARGQLVTNPVNLDAISQADITLLLRDVSKEYYRR